MDRESMINEIYYYCHKKTLTDEEINFLNHIFENNIVNVNYDDGEFILSSAFFGNSKMVEILLSYGANVNLDRAYHLAIQNHHLDCARLLI